MKRAFLLFLCLPLLSACSFVTLERQIYPICMSIDFTQDGRYLIGIQAPRANNASSASYEILTATADTFSETLRTLSASTPYPLNFSQIRLCLVSYPLSCVTHLRPLLRTVLELPSMRPDCYVSIASGSALEVMQQQKPDFGMRLSTHLSLMLDRMKTEDLLPDSTLNACVRDMGDGRSDLVIGLCAVNKRLVPEEQQAQKEKQQGESSAPAMAMGEPWSGAILPEGILSGLAPHTSQNPVEYLGAAAVSRGRVSGMLTADQTQMLLRLPHEAKLKVSLHPLQLQIHLDPESPLAENAGAVKELVKTLQALHCDALLFGCIASTAFGTNEAWDAYDFESRYPHAQVWVGVQ